MADKGRRYNAEFKADVTRLVILKQFTICSMSRKGNCYDNACAETFFSTIKNEMIHLNKYRTREEARRDIFQYIEIDGMQHWDI